MEVYHQRRSVAVQVLAALCVVLGLGAAAFGYMAWQSRQSADEATARTAELEDQVSSLTGQLAAKPSDTPAPTVSAALKPAPVAASTFSDSHLPSGQKISQKIAADLNGDSQQEIVLWVEDTTKTGDLAHSGKGDGTYHPLYLQVWMYADGVWSQAYTYANKQIGNDCGLQTSVPPAIDVFELYPSDVTTVKDGQAELPFVKFKCGGGSGYNQSWFVLDWSQKDIRPLWPAYGQKVVFYSNAVNVTDGTITDKQAVFGPTDSRYDPTGGTDVIVWKVGSGKLTQVSKTHVATNLDLNSER